MTPDEARIVAETEARIVETFPGGAPDQETFNIMRELDDLQTWTTLLMCRNVPKARDAYDLVQRARAFIVERVFHKCDHRKDTND